MRFIVELAEFKDTRLYGSNRFNFIRNFKFHLDFPLNTQDSFQNIQYINTEYTISKHIEVC